MYYLGESLTKGKSDINSSVTTNLTMCKVLDDIQGSVLWVVDSRELFHNAAGGVSAVCETVYRKCVGGVADNSGHWFKM